MAFNKVMSADAVWVRSIVVRLSGMLLGFGLAALLPTAQAQTRSAFLVGNNAYTHLSQFSNAVNDAAAFAGELRKEGFEVSYLSDANSADSQHGLRRFLASISNGGTGVFYFSGHGVQVDGRNFLVPVDYVPGAVPSEGMLSLPALLDAVSASWRTVRNAATTASTSFDMAQFPQTLAASAATTFA